MNKTVVLMRRVGFFDALVGNPFELSEDWNANKRRRYAQGYRAGKQVIDQHRGGKPMTREHAVQFVKGKVGAS